MGTVAGVNTRRYHGNLVAAVQSPDVRTVLLANFESYVTVKGETYGVSTNQYIGTLHPQGYTRLIDFCCDDSAKWRFDLGGHVLAKELYMHQGVNRVSLRYRNESNDSMQLNLRPLVSHKFYHNNFRFTDFYPEFLVFPEDRTMLSHEGITLNICHPGAERTATTGWYYRFQNLREQERGLDDVDDLFCPCELRYILEPGEEIVLSANTNEDCVPAEFPLETATEAGEPMDNLTKSVEKFFISSGKRRGLIAGLPWFTDWGRDTMISLPGLCIESGKSDFGKDILRSYAAQMRQGIVPNRFVDQGSEPDYNTVDATLWFVNCVYLILERDWDYQFASEAMGWLDEIYEWHQRGTVFGIHVDENDGLLSQGVPGIQLTWMDAKVGNWVVTPRHGKPVEINGLWINALRCMEWLAKKLNKQSEHFEISAELAEKNFESKFWHEMLGHYLDTADPADASLRPNQVVAMALPFSPAKGERAVQALQKVRAELLTPYGLRTLSPKSASYIGRFDGPLDKRDSAYHQGTVWPWLIGSYVSATLKLTSDVEHAEESLKNLRESLEDYGLGGIAEVYDGDAPHLPGGCPWQAWSVGEVIRATKEIERFNLARSAD